MSGTDESGGAVGYSGRVGFWLGLAMFGVLLWIPPPVSMREAAAHHLSLPHTDAASGPARDSAGSSEPIGGDAARTDSVAVNARARIMLDTAAVTALVACWWVSVAVPIPVTSLLPLALLPIVGALPARDAAKAFADRNLFLFLGGFILALAIERWGLHRRIALYVVSAVGTARRRIVLGFMIASAMVSMWISNTATTMMLLPIGLAVVTAISAGDRAPAGPAGDHFGAAVMLGIAYGASIGGIATPIGTPPNIAFLGQYRVLYPDAPGIGFASWLAIWLPVVAVFVPTTWLVLTRLTCRVPKGGGSAGRDVVRGELRALGPMSVPERRILIAFLAAALLWMTRSVPLGEDVNYGWASLLASWMPSTGDGTPRFRLDQVDDATVALGIAALLFMVPAGRRGEGTGTPLMDWTTAQRLPWGVLLLFGGGFAIAAGFEQSGLSYWCGVQLGSLGLTDPVVLVAATCTLMTFLTELTSNTATTQIMLPIVARLSSSLGLHPLLLMFPATISASFAFMLPVGTPPNAIVFGSGHVRMRQMVCTGLILNLVGIVLVSLAMFLIAKPLLI